jgi:hypothetical protein
MSEGDYQQLVERMLENVATVYAWLAPNGSYLDQD